MSDWYRRAEQLLDTEINLTQDIKDYPHLEKAERTAYDKILSFLVFLDSLQSNNLPTINEYITANERVNLLSAHTSLSGMCAQPELQLYARLYLQSRKNVTTSSINGKRMNIC